MRRFARGFAFFAAGAATGGAAVALLTPRSGRAMRKALRKEVRHRQNSAARVARNVAGDVRAAYASARRVAGKSGKQVAGRLTSPFRAAS